jgi:putative selenate reductase
VANFTTVPFPDLLRRMRSEVQTSGAIFDLTERKWFLPTKEFDFSVRHISGQASTPVGPAAGPHTQLAQNIALCWLAGARILELKTVQVDDELQIPRPCIHVPNIGFNVEWSQELRVADSLAEYLKAVYLIEILKRTRGFGAFADAFGFDSSSETIYDISVGYNLAGIRSEKVTGFLRSMRNAKPHFEFLREQLTGDLREFRDIELPSSVSDCVTLSTFHGCPAREIEGIVDYLLEELGFHTVVKVNPTLLGYERVAELLFDRLGYHHLELRREAFDQDLQYADGLEMFHRLRGVAERCGLEVGAKFTNTLLVANNPRFFPTQTDPYMYLSGPPLHVISMNLMQRFREDLGFELPVSFSAGINRKNFPAAVACGMIPVTTCTDLLRQGGYGRLPGYLSSLGEAMKKLSVATCEAYVLAAHGHGAEAAVEALRSTTGGPKAWEKEGPYFAGIASQRPSEFPSALRQTARAAGLDAEAVVLHAVRIAGRLNGRDIVPALADDPVYHAEANRKEPRRLEKILRLYDCINCDLCIHACPNDAIFAYDAEPATAPTEYIQLQPGQEHKRTPSAGFAIHERHQLAVVEGLCNDCSNCVVYCPEQGAPFQVKERVFLNLESFHAARELDGFCREHGRLYSRLDGLEMLLEVTPDRNQAHVRGEGFRLSLDWDALEVRDVELTAGHEISFDTSLFWRMKTVWNAIFNSRRSNMVNPDPQTIREARAVGQSISDTPGPRLKNERE